MNIYSLDVLLSQFGASRLFHAQLFLDLRTDFSGGMWGSLAFPSLSEFSSLLWSTQSKALVKEAEVDVFLEFSCFFYDPVDVSNLISDSSAFSKSSLNIWKFLIHMLLKPDLESVVSHFLIFLPLLFMSNPKKSSPVLISSNFNTYILKYHVLNSSL